MTWEPWLSEALGRSQDIAIVAISLDETLIGWYGAASRLFGYSADDIIGRPFDTLFTRDDVDKGMPQVELELARKAGRSQDDRWHARRDGSRFWGTGVVIPHYGPAGEVLRYVKVLRDRTDTQTRYEALQNRVDHLTREAADRRHTLSALVHELRNSLSPMLNAARLAASNPIVEIKDRMHDVIVRQMEVVQRVLQDAGERHLRQVERLELRTIVLQEALQSAVDALRHDATARGLAVLVVCPPAAISIEVDPPRLQQMLLNLLTNAIKYTPTGGRVAVSAGIEGDMAIIRFYDNGVGIASENLHRVFELFTREDNLEVAGFGVGLAVVKRLAWLHGGFVEARSPGKGLGSEFALRLPLDQRRRNATMQ